MESVAPNIFVRDILKTVDYYKHLGFSLTMKFPEEGELVFALMTCGKVTFMFQTFESLGSDLPQISRQDGGSLLLYIQIRGIWKFHEQVKDQVEIIKDIEKTFYGATEFSIKDINGYILTFAEDE